VERLKPAYFTAQQEEQAVSKPCTVQSSMKPPSSRKPQSILKTYPNSSQLKKNLWFSKENKLAKIILNIHLLSFLYIFTLTFLFLFYIMCSKQIILFFLKSWEGILWTSPPPIRKHWTRTSDDVLAVTRPLTHKNEFFCPRSRFWDNGTKRTEHILVRFPPNIDVRKWL